MRGTVDREDAILAPIFTIAAAATVGIADVTLFGTGISDTAFSLGQQAIPFASAISIGALLVAWFTNDADLDSLDDQYTWAVIGTFALAIFVPLVPSLNEFIIGSDWVALGAVAVQSAGFMAVSYFA
jgi:hypothetical protein